MWFIQDVEDSCKSLMQEFTWHTTIEIIAIILAAIFVKRIEKFFITIRGNIQERLAKNNRNTARKLVTKSFVRYRRVAGLGGVEEIIIRTSMENLKVMFYLGIAILIACVTSIGSIVLSAPVLYVAWSRYLRYTSIREERLNIEIFREETKSKILTLRNSADMDDEIKFFWQKIFGEKAPF